MDIAVNSATCIGSAQCVRLAAGVFDLDDAGRAIVVDSSAAAEDVIAEAAEACPTGSIRIGPDSDPQESGTDGRV